MEFENNQMVHEQGSVTTPAVHSGGSGHGHGKWLVLVIIYLLVLGLSVFAVYFWQNNKLETSQKEVNNLKASQRIDESTTVDKDRYQAVFLSSGQVYFGKVTATNQQFISLSDIYYLRNATVPIIQLLFGSDSKDISLVKLGCELHIVKPRSSSRRCTGCAMSGSPPVARQPFMTCSANSRSRGRGGAKLNVP